MDGLILLAFAALAGAASWAGTGVALRVLRARAILDHPNIRSSHAVATPRGGGIAVVATILAGWLAAAALGQVSMTGLVPALAGALALAVVSWIDDLKGLTPGPRLAAQFAAVILVMLAGAPDPVFQGWLPPALDMLLAGLIWLWFINLFNFMDGIDGIAAVETACVAGGVVLVAIGAGIDDGPALLAAVVVAAALGFLPWNWQPARIFLGDVGSVPLGFLLGWLLLDLAGRGHWAPALILPAYYLADATLTLARRALRRAPVWRAHREHFYQRAVQAGRGHGAVTLAVLVVDLALIGCALLTLAGAGAKVAALALGAVSVAVLLWYFRGAVPRRPRRA